MRRPFSSYSDLQGERVILRQAGNSLGVVLFWVGFSIIGIVSTALGISAEFLVVGAMTLVVSANAITDRSGARNLHFLVAAALLGVFPIRYQVAHGLTETTSAFSAALFMLVLFVLGLELVRIGKGTGSAILYVTAGYLAIAFLAALFSTMPFSDIRRYLFSATLNYLIFLIAYLVAWRNKPLRVLRNLIVLIMLCGLIDVGYGLYQFVWGIPGFELTAFQRLEMEEFIVFSEEFIKIIGVSGSAYGLFYSLTLYTVGVYLLLPFFQGTAKKLAVGLLVGSAILLMSFSERTAVVLVLVAIITSVAIIRSRGRVGRMILYGALIVVVFVAAVPLIDFFLQATFGEEGLKFERMRELASPGEAANVIYRYGKWEEGLASIPGSFFLGDGYRGQYGYHMEYLNVLTTFGVGGFLCWFLILGSMFRTLRNLLLHAVPNTFLHRLVLALVSFFVALLAAAIPNNPFTYSSGLVLFVLIAPLFHLEAEHRPRAGSQVQPL